MKTVDTWAAWQPSCCCGGSVTNVLSVSLCFRPAEPDVATWQRSTVKIPFWIVSVWPAEHPMRSWLSLKMEKAGLGSTSKSLLMHNDTFSAPLQQTEVFCYNLHACQPSPVVLQGSVSLWWHLREKTVFRISQKLIYRGRGYGQVNLEDLKHRKTILSDLLVLDLDREQNYGQ